MKKIAIVGSGFGLYGLLPAFSTIKGCEVIAMCGKSSDRMTAGCKQAGVKNVYSDFEQMMENEFPDAIAIAVPPKNQFEIAKYALKNGIAVFAEKPLTVSLSESKELSKLAEKAKLPNMVDFLFPEIPEWDAAKKAIDSREIGALLNFKLTWNFLSYDLKNAVRSWKTDPSMGGGALSFFFSHSFYYMEYLLGKIKKLECVLSNSEKSLNHGESVVNLSLLFESGCIGTASLNSGYSGTPEHSLEFQGENGILKLQNLTDNFVDNFELFKNGVKLTAPRPVDYLTKDSEDARVKVVRRIATRFIRWCSEGVASRPDFSDGLRVQELIEKAKRSNSSFKR